MRSLFLPLGLVLGLMTAQARAEVPRVVADIPPVAALAAQVLGDLGQPEVLLERGGDEHDLQLRPSQMRSIAQADLVVWVGPELTPSLGAALQSAGAPDLPLLAAPETLRRDYASGGVNPHAWLDPDNARAWVGLLADRLALLDPAHATTFRANAAQAQAEIARLDSQMAARLAPVSTKPFLTWHDVLGYFAGHYHLTYLGGLADGDAVPPGAARLAEVQRLAKTGQIACLFPETQHDPALLQALSGVRLGPALDPVGATQDPGPASWDATVEQLGQDLLACLAP